MSWPHREDGTVDWETVFEDETTGLIHFVTSTRSTEALARCAHVIVNSLFIREEDPPYREKFSAAIDELLQSGNENAREKLMDVIQKIKQNRIERVERYLEAGAPTPEQRRLEDEDPTDALKVLDDG
ncbi:hypothetical protein V5T82_02620 [Magnetovibrio sp. PR-2]|uniref:hypothetical protein n=1 Tax=Magnetovibrio sp. PR-2 TaxID=3120356 RepID=UPI002FCE1A10